MSHSQRQTTDNGSSSTPTATFETSASIFDLSNTVRDPRAVCMPPPYALGSFNRRHQRALEYGKSSLDKGDTLVILHPSEYKPLDPTGFALNKDLRVHSRRLISTESKKFEKIFSVDVQRAARELHYPDGLPRGIDFILDLRLVAALNLNLEDETFSDDMPEKLIEELRCPKGIRTWFKSQERCGAPRDLVSGRDVLAATTLDRPSTPKVPVRNHFQPLINYKPKPPPPAMFADQLERESNLTYYSDMLKALKLSAEEQGISFLDGESEGRDDTNAGTLEVEDVLEYCPVRYRIAIEHLLQIIEGKEPTWLDSAPKVWTLYVVAKYFECTHYVTDRIFAWMLASRNEIFMETLPETSLKIGFGLQNSIITRAAFGILVSEEALRISYFDACPEIPKGLLDVHETRFVRARDHLDDVYTSLIEQAAEQFYTRVKSTWQDLSAPKMAWLRNLPEWEKIAKLENYGSKLNDKTMIREVDQTIKNLETRLTDFVRGPIIRCLYGALPPTLITNANNHRSLQQLSGPYLSSFKLVYDNFSPQERTMTRFFWQILSKLEWAPTENRLNWTNFNMSDKLADTENSWSGREDVIALEHGITKVWTSDVDRDVNAFNVTMYKVDLSKPVMQHDNANKKYGSSSGFNFGTFLAQVKAHVQDVCDGMLEKGELDWANTTDTLLCLSEAEWGVLPDWEEREVVIEEPEKEKCELTDLSDWEGADDGSMSEWDLIETED